MIAYEINDIAAPVVNYELDPYTFPTAGVTGTIINRSVDIYVEDENQDNVYNYQISYSDALVGVNPADLEATATKQSFWFGSEDMGISYDIPAQGLDVNSAEGTLNEAKAASNNAQAVVASLVSSTTNSKFHHSMKTYLTSIEGATETINSTQLNRESDLLAQNSARSAIVLADNQGNDTVLLREAAENLAQMQAVIDEQDNENKAVYVQLSAQESRSREATEQDLNAYIKEFSIFTKDPRTGEDEANFVSDPEENLVEAYNSSAIQPEIEDDSLF